MLMWALKGSSSGPEDPGKFWGFAFRCGALLVALAFCALSE